MGVSVGAQVGGGCGALVGFIVGAIVGRIVGRKLCAVAFELPPSMMVLPLHVLVP